MLILLDNAHDTDQVLPLLPGGSSCAVLVTRRRQLTGLTCSHGARPVALGALTPDEAWRLLTRQWGPERVGAAPGTRPASWTAAPVCRWLSAFWPPAPRPTPPFHSRPWHRNWTSPGRTSTPSTAETGRPTCGPSSPGRTWHSTPARAGSSGCSGRTLGRTSPPPPRPPWRASARERHGSCWPNSSVLTWCRNRLPAATHSTTCYATTPSDCPPTNPKRPRPSCAVPTTTCTRRTPATGCCGRTATRSPWPPWPPARHPCGTRTTVRHCGGSRPSTRCSLAMVEQAHRGGLLRHTCQLAWTLSTYYGRRGKWHDMIATQTAALEAATTLGDLSEQARAHRELGCDYNEVGSHDEADGHLARAPASTLIAGGERRPIPAREVPRRARPGRPTGTPDRVGSPGTERVSRRSAVADDCGGTRRGLTATERVPVTRLRSARGQVSRNRIRQAGRDGDPLTRPGSRTRPGRPARPFDAARRSVASVVHTPRVPDSQSRGDIPYAVRKARLKWDGFTKPQR